MLLLAKLCCKHTWSYIMTLIKRCNLIGLWIILRRTSPWLSLYLPIKSIVSKTCRMIFRIQTSISYRSLCSVLRIVQYVKSRWWLPVSFLVGITSINSALFSWFRAEAKTVRCAVRRSSTLAQALEEGGLSRGKESKREKEKDEHRKQEGSYLGFLLVRILSLR